MTKNEIFLLVIITAIIIYAALLYTMSKINETMYYTAEYISNVNHHLTMIQDYVTNCDSRSNNIYMARSNIK